MSCRIVVSGFAIAGDFRNRLCSKNLLGSPQSTFSQPAAPPRLRNARGIRNKDGSGTHGGCRPRDGTSPPKQCITLIQITKYT